MIVAINQPTFLPWLGHFALIDQVDTYVLYDDVQLVKQSWGTRNRIKTQQGPLWITLPIKHNKKFKDLKFNLTEIQNELNWKKKIFKTIQNSYRKTIFYQPVIEWFESIFFNDYKYVGEININFIKELCLRIGINTKFIKSSELKSKDGEKDVRLVKICKELNINKYLSPIGSYNYIEIKSPGGEFTKNNIELKYQNYVHPTYQQLYGDFVSHISILDLLFNVGFDKSLNIIRSGIRESLDSNQVKKIENEQKI